MPQCDDIITSINITEIYQFILVIHYIRTNGYQNAILIINVLIKSKIYKHIYNLLQNNSCKYIYIYARYLRPLKTILLFFFTRQANLLLSHTSELTEQHPIDLHAPSKSTFLKSIIFKLSVKE